MLGGTGQCACAPSTSSSNDDLRILNVAASVSRRQRRAFSGVQIPHSSPSFLRSRRRVQSFSSCRCGTVVPHLFSTASARDAQRRRPVVARQALGLKDAPPAEDATEVRKTESREEFGLLTEQLQELVEVGEDNPYNRGIVDSLDQLLTSLQTCKEKGLCREDREDLQRRVQAFGANALPERSEVCSTTIQRFA